MQRAALASPELLPYLFWEWMSGVAAGRTVFEVLCFRLSGKEGI